jgi:ribosomal protein S18 acetylase RimI-like enzyme
MTLTRAPLEIRAFEPADLDAAADLLADRHRRHRAAEPALDPVYEAPSRTRPEIEALLAGDRAGGWAAVRDRALVGYLIGVSKSEAVWGPNVWVEASGHAASDPAVIRSLYATAAERWLAHGRANHHALVPASDADLVDAWFSLDFGQQHLHAVMDAPPPEFAIVPRSELTIRRATASDIPALVPLERVLPEHLTASPVFSRLPPTPEAEVIAELEEDLRNPAYHYLVAEHEGRVIGLALGASLEISTGATGLNRPADAGYLAYAAVLPDARGLGAGRALGEAVLVWSRDQGYRSIATDWRSTNLEADRAWRGMGFRPTFRRLHRAIT